MQNPALNQVSYAPKSRRPARERSGHEGSGAGGGDRRRIVGCSVLYNLAKLGWSDVVLVEKIELTAGST